MSGLWSVVGIIVLIAGVIFVQLLRSVLASPFPARVRLRALAQARPPEPLAPLFEQADASLSAMGFAHLGWVFMQLTPDDTPGPRLLRLYLSADRRTLAQVIAPFSAQEPHRCRMHLVSQANDGRLLFTVPSMLQVLRADPALAVTQMAAYASLSEQTQAHQALTDAHGDALPWTHLGDTIDRLQAYEDAQTRHARERGELLPHPDGSLRLSVPRAFATLRSALTQPKPSPDAHGDTEIPLRRAILYWRHQRQVTRHSPRMSVQLGLFVLSALAFAALGAWFWDLRFAMLLLAVIALHEAGHWWAMRAFGYRNVQMLMLPMVGGVTIGHEQTPSARTRAWVSLMGPLPGIVLGCALFLAGVDFGSGWLFTAALLLLLINLFNLLPILPLDGGHLLHLLLPERAVNVRMVFDALAIVALAALAWWLDAWWLMLLALVPFGNLRNAGRDGRLLAALRQARADAPPRSEPEELEQALGVVRTDAAAPVPLAAQFALAEQALTQARVQPMRRRTVVLLTALWLGCFATSFALPQVRALIAPFFATSHSMDRINRALADVNDETTALSNDELVQATIVLLGNDDRSDRTTATADELDTVEQRLGQALHPAYRSIMAATGGDVLRETLGLAAPAQLRPLSERNDCLERIAADAGWPGFDAGLQVAFVVADIAGADTAGRERLLDRRQLADWLVLGDCHDYDDSLRLVEPDHPEWPVWELQLYAPYAIHSADFRQPLQQLYVNLALLRRLGGD